MFAFNALAPWLRLVDQDRFAAEVRRFSDMPISTIVSAHSPPSRVPRSQPCWPRRSGFGVRSALHHPTRPCWTSFWPPPAPRWRSRQMPDFAGVVHVALTVSDLDRSVPWYEALFAAKPNHRHDGEAFNAAVWSLEGVESSPSTSSVPVDHETVRRTPTGMDHLAFACPIGSSSRPGWLGWTAWASTTARSSTNRTAPGCRSGIPTISPWNSSPQPPKPFVLPEWRNPRDHSDSLCRVRISFRRACTITLSSPLIRRPLAGSTRTSWLDPGCHVDRGGTSDGWRGAGVLSYLLRTR